MTLGKYRGAGMFLYTRSGEDILILLERRSDDRSWAIQGGGCPPLDSDLAETAVRETLEETGIAVAADCIERVRKYELPFYSQAVFAAELDNAEKPVINAESEEAGWFPLSSLPDGLNSMSRTEIGDFCRFLKRKSEKR